MTRILFFGDMSQTGFGSVTTDLGRALLDLGHDVRFVSQNDLGGVPPEPFGSRTFDVAYYVYQQKDTQVQVTDIRDWLIKPLIDGTSDAFLASGDPWGGWKPDACVLLGDFFAIRFLWERFKDALRLVPTFHYVPIEGRDLPLSWGVVWRDVPPIAMSRFGQREIAKVIGYEPPLAYHGVDLNDFRMPTPGHPLIVPYSPKGGEVVRLTGRDSCRRFFGGDPSHTWIVRTDRNMPRKRYGALFRAMKPVLERHPDARLVLHCEALDQGGWLVDSISKMGAAGKQVVLTHLGPVPRTVLNALLAASDLYVSTGAEGFGLCIAEALAVGIPAVGIDYSAVPEVIGPAGKVVPIAFEYDNEYDHLWAQPDEDAFALAVDHLVEHPAKRRELGALGPKHIADNFQWAEAARVIAATIAGGSEAIAA